MYISIEQIKASLERLKNVHPFFGMSFLAFKKAKLPVGRDVEVIFSQIAGEIMLSHYRISKSYSRFYNPYKSSRGPDGAWVAPRYPSTSLQRITADTFGHVFIHAKTSSRWGWQVDYVESLQKYLQDHKMELLPAFDMAVWIFLDKDLRSNITPEQLCEDFFRVFEIGPKERVLFDESPRPIQEWLVEARITEAELVQLVGPPEGDKIEISREEEAKADKDQAIERKGAALEWLEMKNVGPSSELRYEPSSRLNLIVGDNALGKTFLLDCAFWALTESWPDPRMVALPRDGVDGAASQMSFLIASEDEEALPVDKRATPILAEYGASAAQWRRSGPKPPVPGVVLYARHDGSFAVWDSATLSDANASSRALYLEPNQVLYGGTGNEHREIAGLLMEGLLWQNTEHMPTGKYGLEACIEALSPDRNMKLKFGRPMWLDKPYSSSPMLSLELPYGTVPFIHASAGIRRMVAIAYMLVWSWNRYVRACGKLREEPSSRVILLSDELEAHLHPRWQRRIIPALLEALEGVITGAKPQLHIATHSPLVMASAESRFDPETDRLHHLTWLHDEKRIELRRREFEKFGRIDYWLTEMFELRSPRSVEAEDAIFAAENVQRPGNTVNPETIKKIHNDLMRTLNGQDEFWVRWLSFARRHGVDR